MPIINDVFSPDIEVRSELVLHIVDATGAFRALALEILAEHGVSDIEPDLWYPLQAWLDSLNAFAQRVGPNTLYQMARNIPTVAAIPSHIDNIGEAFAQLDEAYRGSHRGGDVGHYSFVKAGSQKAKIVCENPYPCDFDRGIIKGLAERFEPENIFLDIEHEGLNEHCRKLGDSSCIYSVTW